MTDADTINNLQIILVVLLVKLFSKVIAKLYLATYATPRSTGPKILAWWTQALKRPCCQIWGLLSIFSDWLI